MQLLLSSRRNVKPPLKAIIHGELWEKNILFHRKRFANDNGNGAFKRGSGGGKQRKVFQNGHENVNYKMSSLEDDENSADDDDDDDEMTRHLLAGGQIDNGDNAATCQDLCQLPYDVMLTDWKCAGIGSPTADLAMLLLSCISGSKRQKYTKDILKRYHSSFVCHLKTNFGIDMAKTFPDYNYNVFLTDYELSLYGGFLKVSNYHVLQV